MPHPVDPLVEARWSAEASPVSHLVLPDGCVDVIDRGDHLVVVGPMSRARWVRVSRGPVRGIRLHPGAASWLGIPLSELRDRVVPLRDLEPRALLRSREVPDALAAVATHARARLRRDPRVVRITRRLLDGPDLPIEILAAEVGWTPRHLRRRFDAEIGLSPRRFARVARLRRLTSSLSGGRPLGTLAHEHGFSDQAHMCRDLKALTGLSPSALRGALQA